MLKDARADSGADSAPHAGADSRAHVLVRRYN